MGGWYPMNPNLGQEMQTGVEGVKCDMGYIAHLQWTAAQALAAVANGIHVAAATSGTLVTTIDTGFTQPVCPKNVTATAGGTGGDIKAVQVKVYGLDYAGNAITEDLPAFTVDTPGVVTGSKIFASITKYEVPAMDGAGVTVALGFGEKLGVPFLLPSNTVLLGSKGGTKEATPPTVTADATNLYGNSIDFNSALDGTAMHAWLIC